jgi:FkbM family methyltransferase
MSQIQPGTFTSTLAALFEKGVRYASVIDVGCADGHFFLSHHSLGIFPGASILHVDANAIYEPSLKAIQEVLGGHYFIGAITDHAGEIEMTNAVHPYWNSLRPENDLYWERINRLAGTKVKVPTQTLDALASQLQLKPPYLLKLDVQGAEVQALRGARGVLEETHAVICEVDIDDFEEIDAVLREAGFGLFDPSTTGSPIGLWAGFIRCISITSSTASSGIRFGTRKKTRRSFRCRSIAARASWRAMRPIWPICGPGGAGPKQGAAASAASAARRPSS